MKNEKLAKNTEAKKSIRAKSKWFSWKMFLITFVVLSVLTAGQAMIYDSFLPMESVPVGYIFGIIGYWLLISLGFCLLTRFQIYKGYEKPMKTFCAATKDVANGDFSIWLDPIHKTGKENYIDFMFADFNKMVAELNSIETLKNDFISNVSHEIKTPIATIQNYAEALQNDGLDSVKRKEYTETISSTSVKLSTLVTNILKLNKLENQQITPVAEPYDLCRQLSECALTFENKWEEKNINFEADIEDKLIIYKDESMLEIVWNNLLSNAIKFANVGGSVKLTQTSDSDSVEVSISDTGCGMSEDTVKHIFDKFFQGDSSRSQEGNGLGLVLSSKVLELLGGEIVVESELGKGSVFTVKLKLN